MAVHVKRASKEATGITGWRSGVSSKAADGQLTSGAGTWERSRTPSQRRPNGGLCGVVVELLGLPTHSDRIAFSPGLENIEGHGKSASGSDVTSGKLRHCHNRRLLQSTTTAARGLCVGPPKLHEWLVPALKWSGPAITRTTLHATPEACQAALG